MVRNLWIDVKWNKQWGVDKGLIFYISLNINVLILISAPDGL